MSVTNPEPDGTEPLRSSQYLGYAAGDAANNLTFSMVSAFLLIYYTDVAGISAATAGTLFLVVRVWGGVADLIAGGRVDKTSSRWGRFRPYLLFGGVPLMLLLIAVFSIPSGLSDSAKLAWAFASYALFQLVYSFVNIPYGSLSAAMTQEPEERAKLATSRSIAASVTILVIALVVSPQIEGADDLQASLTIITIVFAVVGVALYMWCFATSRETVRQRSDAVPLRKTVEMLRRNRPLVILCAAALVFLAGMFSLQTVAVYYARDVLGNADFYIWLTVVQTAGMLVAASIVPMAIGVIGKKRTFVVAAVAGSLVALGVAFAPASNPAFGIVAYGLLGVPLGMVTTLLWALQADTVDYGEWNSGVRAEGASYSVLSFMRKAGQAVGGGAAAYTIGLGGYVSGATTQSDSAIPSVRVAAGGVPMVTMLVAGVVMLAYPLTEDVYRRIVGEIAHRRAGDSPAPAAAALSVSTAADDHTDERRPAVPETRFDWQDTSLSPRERAEKLVQAMSLEQKIAQLHGAMETIDIYNVPMETADDMEALAAQIRVERHVPAMDEMGIPRFRITNGPVGVGMGDGTPSPPATSLPMTIGLAAGFDPDLARDYGDIIGSETSTLGQHVLEGPGLCLHRTTIAGRNFEYFSEDPYLSGVMGVEVTRAIQAHDVIAMAKHYVLNDQERERFRASVEVDEQVLREMYLLPFEMVVKDAELAAVMSAYNRIRGVYATEYRSTLTEILRTEWGFEGYVQSDFWSCRSAAGSLNAGMDHEMPDAKWLNEINIQAALTDTSLEIETVDRALTRRYTQMFRFGQFDRPYDPGEIDAEAHGAIARRIGSEIAVLLKNDGGLLPLDPDVGSVVIIGQSAFVDDASLGGGGSSKVDPLYTVPPPDGMRDVLEGLGSSATVTKVTVADDLANLDEAKRAAADADVVVLMAGLVATEGADQRDANMLDDQNEMLAELLGTNPTTVVVLKDGNPVLMPWIDGAPAVLEVWNQGSEDGHVVADLLFGVVNPSGKVPTCYPRSEGDTLYADHPERYPGTDEGDGYPVMRYSEGLEIGYRWFQAQGVEPLFGFGFGLSYTTFDLAEVSVDAPDGANAPVTVTASLTNTGPVPGAEVVQVYLGVPAPGQPPKRLVGFRKVFLEPRASQPVSITIDPEATHHPFSVWDHCTRTFHTVPGDYIVHVGTSAYDTPHVSTVTAS